MTAKKALGPGFQRAGSLLYRAEYGAFSLAIVAYLIWKGLFYGGISLAQTVFWAVFPDLVAFIPIGASSKRREWPSWGAYLYNSVHTVLTWGLVFLTTWLLLQTPSWPLFGWLGHITVDRAVSYGLRSRR